MKVLLACFALIVLAGCATSTSPGAVGVSRPQLMIVPSAAINARAAEGYAQISRQADSAGKLNPDASTSQRVRGIANRLIKHVGTYRPDAAAWGWEVNVIQSEELNAFCAPGGKIAIYTGLIERLDLTDDEIAAIMGHEISHALREHSREKVSQATLTNAVVAGIAQSGARNAGAAGALASVGAKLFLDLPFSREMELEADLMGIELMARGGYDPRQASNVWRKMLVRSGGSSRGDFFSTHPSSDRRIEALEAAVPVVLPLYAGPAVVQPEVATPAVPPTPSAPPAQTPVAGTSAQTLGSSSLQPVGRQATPGTADRKGWGQEWYQVQQLARSWNCGDAVVSLLDMKPGLESYSVACPRGPVHVACEFGACARVR